MGRIDEILERNTRKATRLANQEPNKTLAKIASELVDEIWIKPLVAKQNKESAARQRSTSGHTLSPDRHPQRDFFVADLLDISAKSDMPTMEHPLFALRAGDKSVRFYERGDVRITIKPGHDGCATIHDKDVWIYCISQLVEAINRGRSDVGRVVRFTAHDFLVTANRQTSGQGYKLLGDALARLSGTRIETNIATDGRRERAGFGLIDAWRVIERGTNDRMVAIEVTLPDWLWRSVQAKQVLTLSRDYFRIRKPIDRRIYEIARKHCGPQPRWKVSIPVLHEKSGSRDARRNFRDAMRSLAASDQLPDYRVVFNDADDSLTFYSRTAKPADLLG